MGCGCDGGKNQDSSIDTKQITCNNIVRSCSGFNIPNGFSLVIGGDAPLAINANLQCIAESDTVQCTTTIDGCLPVTGTINVFAVRLKGFISYVAAIPISSSCPSTISFVSVGDSIAVDQVVCVAGPDFVCPTGNICNVTGTSFIDRTEVCANTYSILITFTLPNICNTGVSE